jgi:hypothetical protein
MVCWQVPSPRTCSVWRTQCGGCLRRGGGGEGDAQAHDGQVSGVKPKDMQRVGPKDGVMDVVGGGGRQVTRGWVWAPRGRSAPWSASAGSPGVGIA